MTWRYGVEVLLYLILGLEVVSLFCLLYILAPYFRSPASDRPVKVISDEYIRRLGLGPKHLSTMTAFFWDKTPTHFLITSVRLLLPQSPLSYLMSKRIERNLLMRSLEFLE